MHACSLVHVEAPGDEALGLRRVQGSAEAHVLIRSVAKQLTAMQTQHSTIQTHSTIQLKTYRQLNTIQTKHITIIHRLRLKALRVILTRQSKTETSKR